MRHLLSRCSSSSNPSPALRERPGRERQAGRKTCSQGDPTRTFRDVLEQPATEVVPSCGDPDEGGQEQDLLDEATDLIEQGDRRDELADRLQSAGAGECAAGPRKSFLSPERSPARAGAMAPPPSVARLSWRCQDPLLCVPRLPGVCPSREEIFQQSGCTY